MKREDLSYWVNDGSLGVILEGGLELYERREVDEIFEEGYTLFNQLQLAKLQDDPKKLKEAMENIEDYLESMRG